MENLVGADLIGHGVIVYLDDTLIYSRSLEEHLELLSRVFTRLESVNLKINREKCKFMRNSVQFLGYVLGEKISISADRLEAITKLPTPSNVRELRSFIVSLQMLRRFLPGLAEILVPLTPLTGNVENL